MTEPAIAMHDVSKTFGTRPPVQAVSTLRFEVPRGQVVALVGPNGAGKTTALNLLLGLLRPDKGAIHVLGQPAGSVAARRRIGFTSEIFFTYPFHTAEQAACFYGGLCGLTAERVRRDGLRQLVRLGLGDVLDRRVGTFSKGMVQRLGIALALLHGPELLVLDEPTTGLDPEGRRLVARLIREERERGTTILLSSHILSDVERSCDHLLIMRQGTVVHESDLAALRGASQTWVIEVDGLDEATQRTLLAAGHEVRRDEDGSPSVVCTADARRDCLRMLLDAPVSLGAMRPAETLEDVYMRHVGGFTDG